MSASRIRLAGAALLSLAAHVVLFGVLLTRLTRPPVFPVAADEAPLLAQLVPPPQRAPSPAARPPSRSVPRILARPWTRSDIVEPVFSAADAAGERVGAPTRASAAEGEAARERVRQALRSGSAGCANADAVGLNRRERTHCDDAFGKDMVQIRQAMGEAEQGRLSRGGKPPTDFERFEAAEARLKAEAVNRGCAAGCAQGD